MPFFCEIPTNTNSVLSVLSDFSLPEKEGRYIYWNEAWYTYEEFKEQCPFEKEKNNCKYYHLRAKSGLESALPPPGIRGFTPNFFLDMLSFLCYTIDAQKSRKEGRKNVS